MTRKLVFACLVAVLVLAGAITPASATPPAVRLPFTHPSGGQILASPTTAVSPNQEYRKFITVMNPVQSGYTTDGTYGIDVISFRNHLVAAVSDDAKGTGTSGLRIIASPDGIQWAPITPPGLGINPCYSASWDWTVYRGQLYMTVNDEGICGLPGLVLRTSNGKDWVIVFQDTSGNNVDKLGVFNGMIYLNTNACSPGMIWRSPSGDPGTWTQVAVIGSSVCSWSPFVTFKGYIYTSGTDYAYGPNQVFVLRSADGLNWEYVGQGKVDDPANSLDGDMVVYKDQLYLCTHWWGWEGPGYLGGRIYRTRDGVNWDLVVQNGFGNPDQSGIDSLFVYQNKLMAFALDSVTGITYVYASGTGNAGSWILVNQNGMGANTVTQRGGQTVFKGDLYIGNSSVYSPEDVRVIKMVMP